MKFLITNDDGYDGRGLAALYTALEPLGKVRVVAPAVCHSAKGHAVNTHSPIRVERRDVQPFGSIEIVDSSPADCVRVALCVPGAEKPDFVVAGINTGANLGVDLFYSGTAAAAREAAILGFPSLALSRYMRPEFPVNWDSLSAHVRRVVRELTAETHKLGAGCFWNVNFPAVPDDSHPGKIVYAPQGTMSHDVGFRVVEDAVAEESVTVLEYEGDFRARGKTEQCDVSQLFRQQITATPIDLCTTAPHPLLRKS